MRLAAQERRPLSLCLRRYMRYRPHCCVSQCTNWDGSSRRGYVSTVDDYEDDDDDGDLVPCRDTTQLICTRQRERLVCRAFAMLSHSSQFTIASHASASPDLRVRAALPSHLHLLSQNMELRLACCASRHSWTRCHGAGTAVRHSLGTASRLLEPRRGVVCST